MGADYGGSGPIYALGKAVITGATGDSPGWPGGGWITYQLTNGPARGLVVYVAEDVTPTVQVGQHVTSTTEIAKMYNGSAGIETGWATADSSTAESQMPGSRRHQRAGPVPLRGRHELRESARDSRSPPESVQRERLDIRHGSVELPDQLVEGADRQVVTDRLRAGPAPWIRQPWPGVLAAIIRAGIPSRFRCYASEIRLTLLAYPCTTGPPYDIRDPAHRLTGPYAA